MRGSNVEDIINCLNQLWSELQKAYHAKERLPLNGFRTRHYCMYASKIEQQAEIEAWVNRWKDKLTLDNLKALQAIQNRILVIQRQVNNELSKLLMAGYVTLTISNFTPEDALLFGNEMRGLSKKLKELKLQKDELLRQKKFEQLCKCRNQEKELLNEVSRQFIKKYPNSHFKKSWFRQGEVVHLPNCTYEMKTLLKRAERQTTILN